MGVRIVVDIGRLVLRNVAPLDSQLVERTLIGDLERLLAADSGQLGGASRQLRCLRLEARVAEPADRRAGSPAAFGHVLARSLHAGLAGLRDGAGV